MKKLILSLFLSIIGFIGFSNAYLEKVSCIEGYQQGMSFGCYIPDDFDKFVCNGSSDVRVNSQWGGLNTLYCPFSYDKDTLLGMIGNMRYYSSSDGLYLLIENGLPAPVVEGGTSNITPVITGLFGVYGELIPYVVYIGIGILLVTIGFYAIRRLVNWLSDKIHSNFKF